MGSAPSSQSPSSPEPSPLPKSPKPCSSSQSAKTSLMGPSAYHSSGESRMNSACLGFASAAGVPDRGGDKATVVPIVLFGDVGGVLRSVHGSDTGVLRTLGSTSRSNSANNSETRYYCYYCSAGWRIPE